jgi:precorrin-2 dehydrogenase / sirohydrochlorin ferrochelatase
MTKLSITTDTDTSTSSSPTISSQTSSTNDSTTRAAVKISSFYPFAINLKDRKVLVLGGGNQAYREILRLIDAGAVLTIVAVEASPQVSELLLTHASRATICTMSAEDFLAEKPALADFDLAFLLSEQNRDNDLLSQSLSASGVPCHFLYQPEKSKFVTASPLKRGHLKIAVTTDGLCQPLERAISRRIEELFVYDFDHYSLFLSALEEKLTGLKETSEVNWIKLNQRLEGEEFYQAIARKNFEEALRMVDNHMAAIERGQTRAEDSDQSEIEINRPRNSSKGAP